MLFFGNKMPLPWWAMIHNKCSAHRALLTCFNFSFANNCKLSVFYFCKRVSAAADNVFCTEKCKASCKTQNFLCDYLRTCFWFTVRLSFLTIYGNPIKGKGKSGKLSAKSWMPQRKPQEMSKCRAEGYTYENISMLAYLCLLWSKQMCCTVL